MSNTDGLIAKAMEEVTRDLGLTLKSVIIPRGEPFPYLGRYFVDPAVRTDSFQDPMRTLTKLHLTSNGSVTPEQALYNKACGYWTTDRLTPIIGNWAGRIINSQPGMTFKGATHEEQYKRSNAWPQTTTHEIHAAMAKVLNLTCGELTRLEEIMSDAPLDQIPVLLENELPDKCLSIKDDVVVGPGKHISQLSSRPTEKPEHENVIQSQPAAADRSVQRPENPGPACINQARVRTDRQTTSLQRETRSHGSNHGSTAGGRSNVPHVSRGQRHQQPRRGGVGGGKPTETCTQRHRQNQPKQQREKSPRTAGSQTANPIQGTIKAIIPAPHETAV